MLQEIVKIREHLLEESGLGSHRFSTARVLGAWRTWLNFCKHLDIFIFVVSLYFLSRPHKVRREPSPFLNHPSKIYNLRLCSRFLLYNLIFHFGGDRFRSKPAAVHFGLSAPHLLPFGLPALAAWASDAHSLDVQCSSSVLLAVRISNVRAAVSYTDFTNWST